MILQKDFISTEPGVRLFVQTVGAGPQVVLIPNGYYLFDALARFAEGRTLLFIDPRNRGRSDAVADRSKLERGIRHDVADFEAIRRHVGAERVDLIGHSYMGVTVALYAMTHPDHTDRVVQIGAAPADPSKPYSAHVSNSDGTMRDVFGRMGELQKERASLDPLTFCRKFWAILRELYVLQPSDADRLAWEPCHLPNEVGFMKQYTDYVLPSIQALDLTDADYARATAPVLAIHGRQDRSASYGGGREWALRLPNARLITVDNAAHVPWIEDPDKVFGAIGAFLDGGWPPSAERVTTLD
ncbi:MAG TPA: alpha/beta hydrolase [Vicinamibacterales bacterium]|nr:alpha/beta hydrolase [Vicinamibacterales bacterium]